MLQRILGSRIEFRSDLSPSLWSAEADPSQVETALTNLAINARDAMPDGGVLTIATRNQHLDSSGVGPDAVAPGDYVALSVTDTGVGIPPGELKRVLEPFYTTKSGGLGMGLSICRSIIEAHGGRIWVATGGNRGSIFQFELPIKAKKT